MLCSIQVYVTHVITSGFPTKISNPFRIIPMHAACPAHLIHIYQIALKCVTGESTIALEVDSSVE
jgi:hypothetical protein